MRSRILPAVGIGLVAAAIAVTYSTPASAHTVGPATAAHGVSSQVSHAAKGEGNCYNQLTNDAGVDIVSQNFEAAFDIYDSQGADDFTITKKCNVSDVVVDGLYFNGSGPCTSANVTFYKNKKPSTLSKPVKKGTYTNQAFDPPGSGSGSFTVELEPSLKLKPGTYWVSVQCNMDFSTGGEWGWGTNLTQAGDAALWQNPGDGFGSGCTKYSNMQTCIGALGEGPDFAFQLLNEAKK